MFSVSFYVSFSSFSASHLCLINETHAGTSGERRLCYENFLGSMLWATSSREVPRANHTGIAEDGRSSLISSSSFEMPSQFFQDAIRPHLVNSVSSAVRITASLRGVSERKRLCVFML